MSKQLFVDSKVSRRKFEREINLFRERQHEYHEQGWWLINAKFPEVFVIFATKHIQPPIVAFGVILDFTNYDLLPPSVTLVNPFTRKPYTKKELPTHLPRRKRLTEIEINGQKQPVFSPQAQAMMVAHDENDIPFLCLAGVLEYHQHPAHTDDPWLPHRNGPRGTLHSILEILFKYGVSKIQLGANVQFRLVYNPNDIPE